MRHLRLLAVAASGAALVAVVTPAVAKKPSIAPTFGKAVMLPKYSGGEPSLAIDPRGNGGVYVTAPQGLAGGVPGIGFWASHDGGRTFPIARQIGSDTGGGDSDVIVGKDGAIYVADLEVTANAICRSTDGGNTFVDPVSGQACNGLVASQYGYVSDREWFNIGPDGALYLTYHDFHVELPYTLKSTDQGRSFTPCGPQSFDATGNEMKNFTPGPSSGTQVPRPAIGREGEIYTMFATGTPPDPSGFDHLYLTSTPACSPASVWTSHVIYAHSGADLSQPFDGLAIDANGTLYAVASGHLGTGATNQNVWLFRSTDRGVHWSAPIRVNTPGLTANMLPAITTGLKAGQVAIGWFGSTGESNSDPDNKWRYYVATSFDSGKTFAQNAATGVLHEGAQARALLDFTSIAVEPKTGAVIATFGGDNPKPLRAYVVRQSGGRFLR